MDSNEPRVLAAGLERMAFERIAPELRRDTLGVDWVATPEAGVSMARKTRYDVIIMDAEPCDWPLEKVVHELRVPGTPSRDAAIMILAEPDQVDVARALKSHGVNRVMLISDPPDFIREQMTSLLDVAPRATVRLPTNLESTLGGPGHELFCQTENLSTSGMLVKTPHHPQLGSTVVFKIELSDPLGAIHGRGELVRYSKPNDGGVDGLGVRFLSFASGGAQLLQDYLDGLNREPDPGLDPTSAASSALEALSNPWRDKGSDPEIIYEFD